MQVLIGGPACIIIIIIIIVIIIIIIIIIIIVCGGCPCAFRALSCVVSRPVLCVPVSFRCSPFPFLSALDYFSRVSLLLTWARCHLAAAVFSLPVPAIQIINYNLLQ